ncbi:Molybdenum cofactor sulfurtransferase protein [Dioscorea alata]|uniref:Molybdenum cofactor sulfurtransferase protein n=1 Tax=Dioscorea alata TaxID=55571 RepID=A0ACB7VW55_DIOAL|nr:Molybdenum cofactor sulfurtransferase protein [Dioscorea alata]
MMAQEEPHAKVTSIFIYPIKSCRGISVPQAPISPTGFRWDRQWLVVNGKGRAYTQRVEPRLALVQVELPEDAFDEDWEPVGSSNLVIRAPRMDILKIPLKRTCKVIDGVSVWEWAGSAFDEGDEASKWFSDFIGKPSRLVRFNTSSQTRYVDPKYAQGYKTMFSDGYPFLLISQASLDALNELLGEPVPINRFRPNILVDGCEPFSEDICKSVKLNKLSFNGVKLCSRCKVPTINQENGIGGIEPTETLMKFRSDRILHLKGKHQGKVYFGQNLVCKESLTGSSKDKVVKVGDPVFVLEKFSSSADAPI